MATIDDFNELCGVLDLTDLELLETAYYYAFNMQAFLGEDLVALRAEQIVPPYAVKYIDSVYQKGWHMYD